MTLYLNLTFKQIIFYSLSALFVLSCGEKTKQMDKSKEFSGQATDTFFQEPFRPQFHFSPKEKWMNDPNGLVYHQGTYHMFYQFYPEDIVWGPMHWGHATSQDLIYWDHQKVKLFPDEHGYIFSGSAVVDHQNSSGLGTSENPPLVAIFTYHNAEMAEKKRNDYQTQGLAYSLDNGQTWTKYKNNPVLNNPGIIDFRDPKVFWHQDSNKWIMALAVKDHAEFYASSNLINWSKLSEFGKNSGAHGGVWECPDLFRLKVEGTDTYKWVLIISINPGGPNGGSATQYFTGEFDGTTFKADHEAIKWIDHGADNYAGVTYDNIPGEKKITIGWMSNWNYAQQTPTKKWRSAMTLPRELSLIREEGEYMLRSKVIEAFNKLLIPIKEIETFDLKETFGFSDERLELSETTFRTKLSQNLSFKLYNDLGEFVLFKIDPEKMEMSVDRRKSGKTEFTENFADKIHILPYHISEKEVDIRIILDRSSLEIFADDGKYVMTEQVFPNSPYTGLEIKTEKEAMLTPININQIKTIWKNE